MVLTESFQIPLGSSAPDFSLLGVDGSIYSLDSFQKKDVLAIIFMCNHCPYVQAYIDRLVGLSCEFCPHGVQFVAINSNDSIEYPDDSFDAMKDFVHEHAIEFPYLHDGSQATAKAYHALCTPDLFVYDKQRKLAYHGRIDDNWKDPERVTSSDLREALETLCNGKSLSTEQFPSMGCSIKWKEEA